LVNLFWVQRNILDKLGLVFIAEFKEDDSKELLDWPKVFPLKLWITSKKKYTGKISVK
jgi:hypothetical protein